MPRTPAITPDSATGPPDKHGTVVTVERMIVAAIRIGAFPHVAAAAAGIDPATFDAWMKRAESRHRSAARYRQFRDAVAQAAAHARMNAEIAVHAADPKTWLRSGPGKEREGTPGWSALVKALPSSATNVNILASPEWNGLWAIVLKALATFPDARAAVADALAAMDEPTRRLPPPSA